MRKQYNVNQFAKHPPTRRDILKAKELARRISPKLFAMMEAKTTNGQK